MEKPVPKKPQELVSQITENIPQGAKNPQGFWAKVLDWFRNLFR